MMEEECHGRIQGEFLSSKGSCVHGLIQVRHAGSRGSKMVWLVLFLVGLVALVLTLVPLVQTFLGTSVMSTKVPDHEPFVWPDLTFCNPTAPFSLDQSARALAHWHETMSRSKEFAKEVASRSRLFRLVQEFNTSDLELEEMSIALSTLDPWKVDVGHFQNHVWFYGYTSKHVGIHLFQEYGTAGVPLAATHVGALFRTQFVQMRNNIPCYTFQVDPGVKNPGAWTPLEVRELNSLIFVIRFNYPSYQIINSSYLFRSIFLYVSPRGQMPAKDGILMLPGFNNELTISQTRIRRLPGGVRDSSPCRTQKFRVQLYDALLTSTSDYEGDFDDCRRVASQRLFLDRCGCYNPFLPIFKDPDRSPPPHLCLNASLYSVQQMVNNADCLAHAFDQFRTQDSFRHMEESECGRFRARVCDELQYETDQKKEMWIELWSNSFNDRRRAFIQDTYQPLFRRHWRGRDYVEEMRNDVAMLVIRRASERGLLIQDQEMYSWSQLLAHVGGLMSLWAGLSVLGLCELLHLGYMFLVTTIMNWRSSRSSSSSAGPEPEIQGAARKSIEVVESSCEPLEDTYIFKPGGLFDKRYCISRTSDSRPPASSQYPPSHNYPKLLNGYMFPLDENKLSRPPGRCMHSIISSF